MRALATLLLLLTALATQAEVYRWVDAQGNVHYSDVPVEGAEQIRLPEPTLYSPGSTRGDPSRPTRAAPADPLYRGLRITTPKHNATLYANDGRVTVQVEVLPTLVPSHTLRLYLDGGEVGAGFESTRITLKDVDRGTHQLQARVYDANKQLRIGSERVTFHLKRKQETEQDHLRVPEDNSQSFTPDYRDQSARDDGYRDGGAAAEYPDASGGDNLYPDRSSGSGQYPRAWAAIQEPSPPAYTPNFKQK
ncbi:MAG: DUF4124 domain-containing protein [gamma proteobacterium symbiont of Phacoides pectinatus]